MAAWRYAAWVEARSCTCWPMKSMNLPSLAAVAAFALQGKTPPRAAASSESSRACSLMCRSTDAGQLFERVGLALAHAQAHSIRSSPKSLGPHLDMPFSLWESALDNCDGDEPQPGCDLPPRTEPGEVIHLCAEGKGAPEAYARKA